ncbi:zinc finger protein 62-like [Cimex lectularius]|uniref:C2H2-type domain-containing protein n=1 Tax=Cimex lectularius TaxID=79782 RepID=A0A8I6RQM0_CIMLE|nr:zinc finger protein 62-like [Cimex lectularius]
MPACVQPLKLRYSFCRLPCDRTSDSQRKLKGEKASVEDCILQDQPVGTTVLGSGTRKKPFKCKDCWKGKFELHWTMHSPLKCYVCVVCGGTISSISEIKSHLCFHKSQLHSKQCEFNREVKNDQTDINLYNANKTKPNTLRCTVKSHKLNGDRLSEDNQKKQYSLQDFNQEQEVMEKPVIKDEFEASLTPKCMQWSSEKEENFNLARRYVLVKTPSSLSQIDLNSNVGNKEMEINFLCYKCGAGFTTNEDLVQHESIHNDEVLGYEALLSSKSKTSSGPFLCSCCRAHFKSKIGLMAHETLHRSTLDSQINIENSENLKYSGGSYKATNLFCLLCDLILKSSSDLISHLRDAHPDLPQYVNLETYNDCEDKFVEEMLHSYGRAANSNRETSNSQKVKDNRVKEPLIQDYKDPGNYFCLLCNFGSSSFDILEQHIKGVHPDLSIRLEELQTCKYCQFMCENNRKLRIHMRKCNTKRKNKAKIRRSKRIKHISVMRNIINERTRSAHLVKKIM